MADLRHRPARREHHLRDRPDGRREAPPTVGEGPLSHLRALGATALLVLAAPVLVGCGGGGQAAATSSAPPPTGGYLVANDLERQLAGAFRHGLYRLAVMSQNSDDAMDLGQRLPTGLVRGVHCTSAAAQPSAGVWPWSCDVRWKSVEGRAQRTRYAVRLTHGECFAAGAAPRRPVHYDATIRTYAEDPLNAFASARRGC